jgi:hypothetical protein
MKKFKIESIEPVIKRNLSLTLQINKSEYRIMKGECKGSLWIGKRYDGFRVQTTGDIASILDNEIERLQGKAIGEPRGYKFWYIDDFFIMEKVIDFYGRA